MENIFTIELMLMVYAVLAVLSSKVVKEEIDTYLAKRKGIVSDKMLSILQENKKTFKVVGAILFPLFYCFSLGFYIGVDIYDILINQNDEDRIASWVI